MRRLSKLWIVVGALLVFVLSGMVSPEPAAGENATEVSPVGVVSPGWLPWSMNVSVQPPLGSGLDQAEYNQLKRKMEELGAFFRLLIEKSTGDLEDYRNQITSGAEDRRAKTMKSYEMMKSFDTESAEKMLVDFEKTEKRYDQIAAAIAAEKYDGLETLGDRGGLCSGGISRPWKRSYPVFLPPSAQLPPMASSSPRHVLDAPQAAAETLSAVRCRQPVRLSPDVAKPGVFPGRPSCRGTPIDYHRQRAVGGVCPAAGA